MRFELKDEYIQKGKTGKPSLVILPSGTYKIIMNPMGNPVKENNKCDFLKEKMRCLLIQVGFMGIRVCGDILITLKEMGYDLASKDDWKRAKKQDREKIVAEYEKLASDKPDLFDASKIDLKKMEQEYQSKKKAAAKAKKKADAKSKNKTDEHEASKYTSSDESKKPGLVSKILKNKVDDRTKFVIDILGLEGDGRKKSIELRKKVKKGELSLTKYKSIWKEDKDIQSQQNFRLEESTHKTFCSVQKLEKGIKSQGKHRTVRGDKRRVWGPVQNTYYKDNKDRIRKDVYKLLNDNKGRVFNRQDLMDELQISSTAFDGALSKLDSELVNDEKFMKNDEILYEDGKGGHDDPEYSGWLLCIGKTDKTNSLRSIREAEKKRILDKEKQKEDRRVKNLKSSIIKLLKEQGTKIPASDIDAHLKNKNVDEIKEVCEDMYHDGEINRTGNYRYFVLTKKESKPTQSKQVDIGKELKKYKDLLDQELITQDDYDAKKKELLGL